MSLCPLQTGGQQSLAPSFLFWYEGASQLLGTVLTTEQLFAWMAVFFRLYVRIKIVREPGWDDALILVAAVRPPTLMCTRKQLLISFD